MVARNYELEVLRLNSDGSLSISHLVIANDPDLGLDGVDPETVWTLDGVELAENPEIFNCTIEGVAANGPILGTIVGARLFEVDGVQYLFSGFSYDPSVFVSVSNIVVGSPLGGTNYLGTMATLQGADALQTQGLLVARDAGGNFISVSQATMMVLDDDRTIEIGPAGGPPAAETGQAPVLLPGTSSQPVDASVQDDFAGRMQLVRVEYTLVGGGTGTFDALRVLRTTLLEALIPLDGSVNLDDVAAVTAFTVLPDSLDGMRWSDFGFGDNRIVQTLGTGDDYLNAGILFGYVNNKVAAKGGNDTIIGAHGNDLLTGGGGADDLFGGLSNDDLQGGGGGDFLRGGTGQDLVEGDGGNDDLFGSSGDDTLLGGSGNDDLSGDTGDDSLAGDAGNDDLFGGAGNDTLDGGDDLDELSGGDGGDELTGGAGDDTLDGGAGKDALFGGADADTLIDGKGEDTLEGGSGADVFVLLEDGSTDHVTDFRDGTDLLDLGTNFGQLVFTDVAPGEVHIEYRGEVVIVTDTGGTLTSADFSGADFL